MAEWFKAAVLKTAELKGSVSSNLTLSVATIAQLVEHPICNRAVIGSNPIRGSYTKELFMHPMVEQYLVAFTKKDLETLATLYHDDVVLWEWGENIFMGKEKVLEANKQLFDGTKRLGVVIQADATVNADKHMAELSIMLDDKMISVVDVISLHEGKIITVQAYRGF